MTAIRTNIPQDVAFIGADHPWEVELDGPGTGKTFRLRLVNKRDGNTEVFTKNMLALFDIGEGTNNGVRFQIDSADTLGLRPDVYAWAVYEPDNPRNPVAVGDVPLTYAPGVSDQ